ncbi:MAG: phytanoyl-CoA hydroxylase [Gammaproteobacteria bacterium]
MLHAIPSDVKYVTDNFGQGIGPIYSRYKRLGDNILDEKFFPILWQEDGYKTPQINDYLSA